MCGQASGADHCPRPGAANAAGAGGNSCTGGSMAFVPLKSEPPPQPPIKTTMASAVAVASEGGATSRAQRARRLGARVIRRVWVQRQGCTKYAEPFECFRGELYGWTP